MSVTTPTTPSRAPWRLPPPATAAGQRTDSSDRARIRRPYRRRSHAAVDYRTTPARRARAGRNASTADPSRCRARMCVRPKASAQRPTECARRAGSLCMTRSDQVSCSRRAGCRVRGHSTKPSRERMRSLFVLASVRLLWHKSDRSPCSPRTKREVTRFRWAGIGTCSGPCDDACHPRGASCC